MAEQQWQPLVVLLVSSVAAVAFVAWQRRKRAARSSSSGLLASPPATTAAEASICRHLATHVGDEHAQQILAALREPPLLTTIRVNLASTSRDDAHAELAAALSLEHRERLYPHEALDDMLCLPLSGPHARPLLSKFVAVDRACAEAVLRGAHIFTPGVLGCSADLVAGDDVSVVTAEPRVEAKQSESKAPPRRGRSPKPAAQDEKRQSSKRRRGNGGKDDEPVIGLGDHVPAFLLRDTRPKKAS